MPRLSTALLRQARAHDPLLVLLLRSCRSIGSAQNEFRWLKEHVEQDAIRAGDSCQSRATRWKLRQLCEERGRGKPLQYLLGTEFFGDLELLCRPGVLIPRPETADSLFHLVERLRFRTGIRAKSWRLRILDLCTGSGCMSLLLHHELHKRFRKLETETLGIDVSAKALQLARDNLKHVGTLREDSTVSFKRANILEDADDKLPSVDDVVGKEPYDILITNPPYISSKQFYKETARSVRQYEPRLALVPGSDAKSHAQTSDEHDGDTFYPRIADLADRYGVKVLLMEVGDTKQAIRVADLLAQRTREVDGKQQPTWHVIEIWCDGLGANGVRTRRYHKCGPFHVPVVGPREYTHGRTVACWRNEAVEWMSSDCYIDGMWAQQEAPSPWTFPVNTDFRTFSLHGGEKSWYAKLHTKNVTSGSSNVGAAEEEKK